MKQILRYIKDAFCGIITTLSGAKIKKFEDEDELAKVMLKQQLVQVNGKRVVLFSLISVIAGLILLIYSLVTMTDFDFAGKLINVFSGGIATIGAVVCCAPVLSELKKRMPIWKKIERYTYIFWGIIVFSLSLMVISDFVIYKSSQSFFICIFVFMVVPVIRISIASIYAGFLAITVIISGLSLGVSVSLILMLTAFIAASLVIASLMYNSYSCLFISERLLKTANERCRQITEKDAMTGMFNKLGLSKRLTEIISTGSYRNLAAIFIDIDNFRRYNQLFSDQESDECLYKICNCIRIIAKTKTRLISRFGGDEFVLVIQNIDEYDLISFAEQIRRSIETMALPFEGDRIMSISIGVSGIKDNSLTDYSILIKEAEQSLEVAKAAGRNCVGYAGKAYKSDKRA